MKFGLVHQKKFTVNFFLIIIIILILIFVVFSSKMNITSVDVQGDESSRLIVTNYHISLKESINDPNLGIVYKYEILTPDTKRPITYRTFFEELKNKNDLLIENLSKELSIKYEAVFWECKPFRVSVTEDPYLEFVIINSPQLAERQADPTAFEDQFHLYPEEIISFENLSKDAALVVPRPPPLERKMSIQFGTHLASFLRGSTFKQRKELWAKVGQLGLSTILNFPNTPIWLSTSGLGVSWLHIRFDKKPKYYNWQEYKSL